jgi:hypothetical protein
MGCITNDISKEAMHIKAEIMRYESQIDNYKAEIDDMEGDIILWEDALEELENDLARLETDALDWGPPMEIYFDNLVENLVRPYDYEIERDPWIMEHRWGITGVHFCCLMERSFAIYTSTDFYPTKDSVMTLRGRYA